MNTGVSSFQHGGILNAKRLELQISSTSLSSLSDIFLNGGKIDGSRNDSERTQPLDYDESYNDSADAGDEHDYLPEEEPLECQSYREKNEEISEASGSKVEFPEEGRSQLQNHGGGLVRLLFELDIKSQRRTSDTTTTNNNKKLQQSPAPKKKPLKTLFHRVKKTLDPIRYKKHLGLHSSVPARRTPARRSSKRKRTLVSFATPGPGESIEIDPFPTVVMSDSEIESTWYSDEEYEAIKRDAAAALGEEAACGDATAREAIARRKEFKMASRDAVYDEQEDQRLSGRKDPEAIRRVYEAATALAGATALETGRRDEAEVVSLHGGRDWLVSA